MKTAEFITFPGSVRQFSFPSSGLGKLVILILLVLTASNTFAQKVSEKQLTDFQKSKSVDMYNVRYDAKTGAYAYLDYGDSDNTTVVVTSKGRSEKYSGSNTYDVYFDASGNVYSSAYNLVNDTVYTYFMLKNGVVIGTFDYINDFWAANNGTFYFVVKDKKQSYLAAMDMASGAITKSNAYDDVVLVNITERNYRGHGEPPAYPGFTAEGKPYYVAMKDSEFFMVIGGVEQKHYKDIDIYNVLTDKNGDPVYLASESGSIYNDGAEVMLVQGTKEYRKFSYIYPPVLFDNNNVPVYVGGEKTSGNLYPQTVMKGNDEVSKKYSAGITDLQFTSSGKLAFVGNTYIDSVKSYANLVIDGKETRKQSSIFNVTFLAGDVPMYLGSNGKKQFVVKDMDKISNAYEYIPYFRLSPGGLTYIGTNYADGSEDKNYIYVEGEKYGPFVIFQGEDMDYGNVIASDDAGNYVFAGTKLLDKKNYIYESYVYSKNGKSGPYSSVDNLTLYNGKPLFTGYIDNKKKEETITTGRINYNMKDITRSYSIISDYNFDPKTGTITFLGSRNENFYFVEIKL